MGGFLGNQGMVSLPEAPFVPQYRASENAADCSCHCSSCCPPPHTQLAAVATGVCVSFQLCLLLHKEHSAVELTISLCLFLPQSEYLSLADNRREGVWPMSQLSDNHILVEYVPRHDQQEFACGCSTNVFLCHPFVCIVGA